MVCGCVAAAFCDSIAAALACRCVRSGLSAAFTGVHQTMAAERMAVTIFEDGNNFLTADMSRRLRKMGMLRRATLPVLEVARKFPLAMPIFPECMTPLFTR